jgi:hypothetical protein
MGDISVIGFKATEKSTPIWLYSHWGGCDRYGDVARALVASQTRWTDPTYATRIAISTIIGSDWSEEVGFGLSCGADGFSIPDYDDIPVIVWSEEIVEVYHVTDLETPRYNATFRLAMQMDLHEHAEAAVRPV